MRIYLIGAASTGKTTLGKYIAQSQNMLFLPEQARAILAEQELHVDSLRTNLDTVNQYQNQIIIRQIEEEKKCTTSFVSDRSFDALAYTAQYSTELADNLAKEEVQDYFKSLKQDDVIIFWVRPSTATLKQDGVRETIIWDSLIAIDSKIHFMLEMYKLRYFQINVSSMQERIRFVDNILSLVKEQK